MRMMLFLAAVLTFLPSTLQAQNGDAAAVLATIHRVFDGMREADSAKVRTGFAEGARFAILDTREGPARVAYQEIDGWLEGVANSDGRWDERIYKVDVKVDGDMASAWTPYTFFFDGSARHCGVNSIELLRTAEGWKITQLSDTRRREGCPAPGR